MKKVTAILLCVSVLFLICSVYSFAEEGTLNSERISFSRDELTEKTGIKQILLPKDFIPEICVYYNKYSGEGIFPEYLTVLFEDNTEINSKLEPFYGQKQSGEINLSDGERIVIVFSYECSRNDYSWHTDVQVFLGKDFITNITGDCVITEQSFKANITKYFKNIYGCFQYLLNEGTAFMFNDALEIYNITAFLNDVSKETQFLFQSIVK